MKLWKKILIGLVIVIILALGVGYMYLKNISNRGLPNYNLDVTLKNMTAEVTVYRDNFAVPQIYAQNPSDLYRATGYIMAQDRLWQMDLLRRVTAGRLCEIFGKDLLDTDLLMRALRITEKSNLMLSKTPPHVMDALNAFADGVNQFIDSHADHLPPEFTLLGYTPEKWEPVHSVNLVGYMGWDLAFAWHTEAILYKIAQKLPTEKFQDMLPVMTRHKTSVFPDFTLETTNPENNPSAAEGVEPGTAFNNKHPINRRLAEQIAAFDPTESLLAGSSKLAQMGLQVFHGSNNWAVSGKKSVTGKPILANDMHLGLFIPGIWYQMHQVIENGEDQINVTGVALPGAPFVVAGHNERIAWGMTNVMVDDLDLYLETINPKNKNQYRFNNQWKDIEIKKVSIKIKGGNTIEDEIRFTHRGPIISRFKKIKDQSVSLRWIGNLFSDELMGVYLLNRAGNWQQFREALKLFRSVSQNVVYADVDGNIGLQTAAGLPIRKGAGMNLVPGDTDEYDWTGVVPFEELPYSYNPESGFVSSANNKTANDAYPHYISNWFILPNRIDRIRELLTKKETLSIEDFKLIQADRKSAHVAKYLPDILSVLKKETDFGAAETKALELLEKWDYSLDRESPAAALFEKMFVVMVERLAKDELEEKLFDEYLGFKSLVENLVMNIWEKKDSPWFDDVNTTPKEDFSQWITASFEDTVQRLRDELDNDPANWQWGKLHHFVLKHPMGTVKALDFLFSLNRGPYEIGGSFHTVGPYSYSFRKPFDSSFGASQRHIYSIADWDYSLSIIPTGISGIPASPFYCDQTPLYIENKYRHDYLSKQKVTANAVFTMKIMKDSRE